ncbi:MAG: 4Fe-4S dicluster domain-containing protein [bacterium]
MAVLINFKICDNSKDCDGIKICPTKAFYWDKKKKTITVDNKKCINCGRCEEACLAGAIKVAKTEKEYKKIKKEIDEDPRKVSDLFIDRYGAQPLELAFLCPQEQFNIQVLGVTKTVAVEFLNPDLAECLICSIPIKNLLNGFDIMYRKIKIKDKFLLEKYKIKNLPALLFFKNSKLIGKIEKYYDIEKIKEIKEKIDKILTKVGYNKKQI